MDTEKTEKTNKPEKLNVKARLAGTKYEDKAGELADAFASAGITTVEQLHNAPLLVRTTYGADIYDLIKLLAKPVKENLPVKEAHSGNSTKD